MSHIEELTDGLMATFRLQMTNDIEADDAEARANVAGKIINAYKTRLAYAIIRGDQPLIEGLESSASLPAPRVIGRSAKIADAT